jgi:hypothetical protein
MTLLLRETEPPEGPRGSAQGGAGLDAGEGRIRCPLCGWRPRRSDRWSCSCGHVWNTFETRARCPACARQWHETQCLSCHRFSRHEDWYEEPRPG